VSFRVLRGTSQSIQLFLHRRESTGCTPPQRRDADLALGPEEGLRRDDDIGRIVQPADEQDLRRLAGEERPVARVGDPPADEHLPQQQLRERRQQHVEVGARLEDGLDPARDQGVHAQAGRELAQLGVDVDHARPAERAEERVRGVRGVGDVPQVVGAALQRLDAVAELDVERRARLGGDAAVVDGFEDRGDVAQAPEHVRGDVGEGGAGEVEQPVGEGPGVGSGREALAPEVRLEAWFLGRPEPWLGLET
jgi:hypothetical protein